jgi:hypothetical protein
MVMSEKDKLSVKLTQNETPEVQPHFVRLADACKKKFPTAAFVAGRLKEVGWESEYEKSLLDQFREDLTRECGDELSEVLEYFRLISFKPPSREVWSVVPLL